MDKIPVTNHGTDNLHVGGAVIRPGETLHVPAHLVPPGMGELSAQANDEPPEDPVLALHAAKAADVVAALPTLDIDSLHQLEALEASANKPRKSVLEVITAEHLRRASEGAQ